MGMTKIEQLNDDGWVPTTLLCLTAAGIATIRTRRHRGTFVAGFVAGITYEQLVEWAAHGWLQSEPVEGFEFFRWRHGRHHRDPESHHALQPISIWLPVVTVLLGPALLATRARTAPLHDLACAMIAGFLVAHAGLNVAHYDIHAPNKIVPGRIRRSRYYRSIERIHIAHHEGSDSRIYGVTNPWLDMLLEKVGATGLMDRAFRRVGRWAKRVDPVWYQLDPTWHSIVDRRNGATEVDTQHVP
jgi:sterol desaturase/sphingolipid hydroxylase (fatty acid hydroxylase superfamily)